MKMDNAGERPESGGPDSADGSESWYFDLPSGAWERQEQKNRELRQRVLENAAERSERDPFARRKPEPEAKKGGLFGFGRKKEAPVARETAGGTYRLARPGELASPPAPGLDDDDDWSTESFDVPPATLVQPPARVDDDEWGFTPADDADEGDGLPRYPEERLDGASEDGLAAMHAWATRAPVAEPMEELPAEEEVSEHAARMLSDDASIGAGAVPRFDEPEPATSGWGGIFGHTGQSDEDDGLAAMSAWARRRPVDSPETPSDGEHPPVVFAPDDDDSDVGPKSWAEIRALRQKQHEEEMHRDAGTATSRWESMFNVRPGEAGQQRPPGDGDETPDEPGEVQPEGLAAMRAWLEKGPVIDEDEHPRRILAGDDEDDPGAGNEPPLPVRAELLEPFDWERDETPASPREVPPELLKPFDWESDERAEAIEFREAGDDRMTPLSAEEVPANPLESVDTVLSDGESIIEPAAATLKNDAEAGLTVAAAFDMPPPAQPVEPDLSIFGSLDPEPSATMPPIEPPGARKRGFLGRLFGRNEEIPAPRKATLDEATPDWFAVDEDAPAGDLGTASLAADSLDAGAADLGNSWVEEPEDAASVPTTMWQWPDSPPGPATDEADGPADAMDATPWQSFGSFQGEPERIAPMADPQVADTNRVFGGYVEASAPVEEEPLVEPAVAFMEPWEPFGVTGDTPAIEEEPSAEPVNASLEDETEETAATTEPWPWEPFGVGDAPAIEEEPSAESVSASLEGETEETAATTEPWPWASFGVTGDAPAIEEEPSVEPVNTFLESESEQTAAATGPWEPFGTPEPTSDASDDHLIDPLAISGGLDDENATGGWAPEAFDQPVISFAGDDALETAPDESQPGAAEFEPAFAATGIAEARDEEPWAGISAADAPGPSDREFAEPAGLVPGESPAEPTSIHHGAAIADVSGDDAEAGWSWDFNDLDDDQESVDQPLAINVGDDEFAWAPTDNADGEAPVAAWLAGAGQPGSLPVPARFDEMNLVPDLDDDPRSALSEAGDEGLPAAPEPLAIFGDDTSDEPWAAADMLDAAGDEQDQLEGKGAGETMVPDAELENSASSDDPGPPHIVPFPQDDPWAEFIARREREVSDEERVAAERWNTVFGTAPQGKSDAEAGDGDQTSADAATAETRHAEVSETGSYDDPRRPMSPPAAGAEQDDPWAAIAAASGYDAATESGMAVYMPGNAETPADDPWQSFTARHQRPATDRPDLADTASAGDPSPAAPWDDDETSLSPDEFIVRAFERKAAEALPEEREPDPIADADADKGVARLLGDEGEDIMRETAASEAGPRSFARMSAWAPQRSGHLVTNPNEAPWESDQPAADDDFTGLGGPSYEPSLNVDVPAPPFPPAAELDGFDPRPVPLAAGQSKTRTWVREVVETGLLALLVFLAVRASFQNFKVDGSSMYPTLQNGQFLIVNKLEYSQVDMEKLSTFLPFVDPGTNPKRNVFHPPQRGDIVVLKDPRKPDTDLIKRIIALPGESVEIVNGRVYINDHLLEEPYIKSPWHDTKSKITIPDGQYYVLGDNRDNSLDSRSSQVGLVPGDLIIGKATLSYWPLERFGLAPNQGGDISSQDGPPRLTAQLVPSH